VLEQHTVATAYELGWTELDNGRLLAMAEAAFDALVTTDKNLRHQQNLAARRLAILVLPTHQLGGTAQARSKDRGCDQLAEAW
jgi:hypothetical protein